LCIVVRIGDDVAMTDRPPANDNDHVRWRDQAVPIGLGIPILAAAMRVALRMVPFGLTALLKCSRLDPRSVSRGFNSFRRQ
jgi:hypothetical protein